MRYIRVTGVILAVLAAAFAVLIGATVRHLGPNMPDQALLQARKIAEAIHYYHRRTGSYPESLDRLAMPIGDGGRPHLEDWEFAITDPWGKRFNFEVVTDEKGDERVVVWTTDNRGERIQWPPK
jgi:hypothetical protein